MSEDNIRWTRNEEGLIDSIEYVYDEYGAIDWKAMIPDKFKYPNKDWFYKHGKEKPDTAEGLTDEQTIISLKGCKWIAKLRGFTSVDFWMERTEDEYVSTLCKISWMENVEEPAVSYTEMANATSSNTNLFCEKFLETVAANRAFCRCVRNFLNINSVSEDEIDSSEEATEKIEATSVPNPTKPQGVLEQLAREKSYESFKDLQAKFKELEFFHAKMDQWVEYDNVPAKYCRQLIAKLKGS